MGKPEDQIPVDFVAEAEKIVHNYMVKRAGGVSITPNIQTKTQTVIIHPPRVEIKKKHNMLGYLLAAIMLLACFVVVGIIAYGLLG